MTTLHFQPGKPCNLVNYLSLIFFSPSFGSHLSETTTAPTAPQSYILLLDHLSQTNSQIGTTSTQITTSNLAMPPSTLSSLPNEILSQIAVRRTGRHFTPNYAAAIREETANSQYREAFNVVGDVFDAKQGRWGWC